MRKRILYFFIYLVFWYLFMTAGRILFLLVNMDDASGLSFREIMLSFLYGFRLDASMASYLSFLPAIVLGLSSLAPLKFLSKWIKPITYFLIFILTGIYIIDAVLYTFWDFRLDATPLFYMNNLKAMTASLPWLYWMAGFAAILIATLAVIWIFRKMHHAVCSDCEPSAVAAIVILFLTALLIIPARGGLGVAALNNGSAYFSQKPFANHTALNPAWNFIFSVTEKEDIQRKYLYYSGNQADTYTKPWLGKQGNTHCVLRLNRPNIVLIIVESLTAKVLEATGGRHEITPNLNSLVKEGILFNQIFAASDRTDKGLAAVLAGYPSLPGTSPLKYQKLTEHLHFIPSALSKEGYNSSFFYGGSLDFANYRSFLTQAGFDKLYSDVDFDLDDGHTKWGAWDHEVLNKMISKSGALPRPFFSAILTLTSHEPFKTPVKTAIKGNDKESLFLNSLHYTDEALGDFIRQAKKQSWWDSTLVIITADHGSILPGNSGPDDFGKYHIPMLWLGGALAVKDTLVKEISSQTDIASTLLAQLGLDDSGFLFSKNILSDANPAFAFYTYQDGFVCNLPADYVVFNTISGTFAAQSLQCSDSLKNMSKAYLQKIYMDFYRIP